MTALNLAVGTALCGLLAVAAAGSDAPIDSWWVAVPGFAAAVAVLWRPGRVLTALVGLSALGLVMVGDPGAATAVLVGVLLLGFGTLVDLVDDIDQPQLSQSVPATEIGPTARTSMRVSGAVLAGWARCALPVWLVGTLAAVAVAAVGAAAWRPAPWLVATAPLLALVAALIAVGRTRD